MKRFFLSGVAIAACFGLATTASAQYGSNYQYSSYGYGYQEADQEHTPSPSDIVPPATPDATANHPTPATPAVPMVPTQGVHNAPAGAYGGGCDGGSGCGPGIGGAGCGTGLHGLGCGGGLGAIGNGDLLRSNDRNVVFGVRGLIFERDYEDDRGLGSNALNQYLFSTDADHDFFGGVETTLSVRNCSGCGWGVTYWGLYPDEDDYTFANPPLYTTLVGGTSVALGGQNFFSILNTADSWRIYRSTEIHNLEFNLLRNGGQTQAIMGGCANIEWIAGFRWFKFSEEFRLASNNSNGGYPPLTLFDLDVENNLLGFQLGANIERSLGCRTTLSLGTKFGVYNNDIYARQRIQDGAGTYATVPSGPIDYNFGSEKDDIATLGELDLGLNYQFSDSLRANFGYRLVGVTSVALAADQIPYNFDDTQEIQRIKSNGSLLLHGVYFGIEKCF